MLLGGISVAEGHGPLSHSTDILLLPGQYRPPFWAAGESQYLIILCTPLPQVVLQRSNGCQTPQPPLTIWRGGEVVGEGHGPFSQGTDIVLLPGQCRPPFWAAGESQYRIILCTPLPQVVLQTSNGCQLLHPP